MPGVPQQGIGLSTDVPSAAPAPYRSASSFGADIGEGVEQLGSVLQQQQVRAKELAAKRQYEVDASAAGVASAQAQSDVAQQIEDIRNDPNAAPGGAGHVEAVGKAIDGTVQPVLAGISNPVLRGQFAEDLARFKAQKVAEEAAWASGQRVAYQVANHQQTQTLLANNILNNPDDATFAAAIKTSATAVANQGLPTDVGAKLLREDGRVFAEAQAKSLTLTDPAAALDWLGRAKGTASTYIPADRRAELIGQAETQLRIRADDQKRQLAQQAEQWRADVTEARTKIAQGALLSDDDMKALVSRGQAFEAADPGTKNLVEGLQYDEGKLKYSRLTDKWTTPEWDQAINPLAAKVAQGKASDDEQRELKILQELRPAKEQRIRNDPDGVSAANGVAPPVVDIANPDPGAVQARKSWAQGFARTYRSLEPPYLTPDQVGLYKQRVAQGPVGQLDVAEELKSTWGMDAAPSIVRQIGGDAKNDMMVMLGLNPGVAQIYRQGREALEKKAVQLNDDVSRQVAGTVLRGVPADMRPAVFDAARNIAAGWMQRQGFTSIPSNFSTVFAGALQYAGGRGGDVTDFNSPGGFAELNGRYAWLPSDMTSNDFLRRVARAQPQDWVNAATDAAGNPVKSVPHYIGTDGKPKPYTKGDAARFNKGTFETVAPGIYRLIDPLGHTVVDEKGQPWSFDVRRLGR